MWYSESLVEELVLDATLLDSDVTLDGGVVINGSALIGADGAYPVVTSDGWGYAKPSAGSSKINVCP